MPGVSWNQRQPTDWLASNGRWYPADNYPRSWNFTSLPPAPGHGGATSILRKYAEKAGIDLDAPIAATFSSDDSSGSRPTPPSSTSAPSPRPKLQSRPTPAAPTGGFSVANSGRSVANATVSSQHTRAERVGAGAPPPPALPAPPGRVRDDAPRSTSPAPPDPATRQPFGVTQHAVDSAADELGTVFGTAKRRIERALNDAAENN